jgi:hypothetical protein
MRMAVGAGAATALVIAAMFSVAATTREAQVIPTQTQTQTPEPPEPTQTPKQRYQDVSQWCEIQFPYRKDLAAACQYGAYVMVPETTEKEA